MVWEHSQAFVRCFCSWESCEFQSLKLCLSFVLPFDFLQPKTHTIKSFFFLSTDCSSSYSQQEAAVILCVPRVESLPPKSSMSISQNNVFISSPEDSVTKLPYYDSMYLDVELQLGII